MNTYSDSYGNRYTQAQIDKKINQAKAQALQNQVDDHGYNFCEQCDRNGSGTRLDCSHDISVKRCKEVGRVEQAWNVGNIVIRCRQCHQKHDGLDLRFANHY